MYTDQKALWSPVVAPSKLNMFGDAEHSPEPTEISARIQPHVERISTSQGVEALSKHYYYVSPPIGMDIFVGDRLDGELIVNKYVMYAPGNKPKMVRFITI